MVRNHRNCNFVSTDKPMLDGQHLTEKIDSWDFQCTILKQESNDKYIHLSFIFRRGDDIS